ncbi:hypothetical protein [Streptomyces sp. Da 82-17]|uniref:hypothetical protein n=1 Tax=Streptomyces sp. Da 82-17 TaxID=3377116 RepID=UPI0038D50AFB
MATTSPLVDTRRPTPPARRRQPPWAYGALPVLVGLAVLAVGHRRRWMSDDGHIYVRTVRQILAGNGPVFNAGERAEASTGTLWQWLLAAAGLPGWDVATVAVYGGLLLTAAGFVLAGLGCLRLYGTSRALPLGALVLLALPPVWDFATSGLETGLATCWLAASWLLLTTAPGRLWTSAVLGLGPLVRPELGLVSAVFLAAQWLTARPGRRRTLAALGAALATPLAYEVFRAGYYGHLVPLPGVTKEASQSLWGRGLGYLADLANPYVLWLPALFLAAALLPARAQGPRTPLIPTLAPPVAGLLCWLYVIKVGGDFMHGRMLLPGLFLLLLPVFLVPATRPWTLAAAATAVWALVCAAFLRVPYEGRVGPGGIADERGVYVHQNAHPNPVRHTFAGAPGHAAYAAAVRRAVPPRLLLLDGPSVGGAGGAVAVGSGQVTGVHNVLGMNGTSVPLPGAALDPIGLAYPLAAHSEQQRGGRVGHDKRLPVEWILADRGATRLPPGVDPSGVAAARRALACPPLADLRAAARDPLSPGRFAANVRGAWARTMLRFPNDPREAERVLCAP